MVNGTLAVSADQGVHSLTDVPVFAQGPCQEMFGGEFLPFLSFLSFDAMLSCWIVWGVERDDGMC